MKRLYVAMMLACLCCGCTKQGVQEERPAISRLHAVFDSIYVEGMLNSNRFASTDFHTTVFQMAKRDTALKELLARRTGGSTSLLLLNTNVSARITLETHGRELAIILPDPIEKEGKSVGMGIRFDGQIVYFNCLSPAELSESRSDAGN